MKKLLFPILSILILFTACSDDDVNPSAGTQLKKIRIKHFHNDTPEPQLAQTDIIEYTNGLLTKKSYYGHDNSLISYQLFNYEQGLLDSIITYTIGGVLYSTETFTYDIAGRMINYTFLEDNNTIRFSYQYTFNDNNTITVTSEDVIIKTYYINADGLIYKESNGEDYTLTFDGNNVISSEGALPYQSKIFEYDDIHDMSILGIKSVTGDVKANSVLMTEGLEISELATADRYLTKIIRNGGNPIDYVYTFNSDGYPLQKTMHLNSDMATVWDEHTYYY